MEAIPTKNLTAAVLKRTKGSFLPQLHVKVHRGEWRHIDSRHLRVLWSESVPVHWLCLNPRDTQEHNERYRSEV